MKTIDTIIIHCSATPEGKEFHAADIDLMHKEKGFACIGYNFVVDIDGTVEVGRPTTMNGAHCKGWNDRSIGICYIGGIEAEIDKKGQIVAKLNEKGKPIPKDTRTMAQKKALHDLVENLLDAYPSIIRVIGHRDTSPDLNGDGKITPNEWIKDCPCFDVQAEFPISYCTAKR